MACGPREAERLAFKELRRIEEYSLWRLAVVSTIIAGSADPAATRAWIEEVEHATVIQLAADPPELAQLSAKVYSGPLNCLKGENGKRVASAIRNHGCIACGRVALVSSTRSASTWVRDSSSVPSLSS